MGLVFTFRFDARTELIVGRLTAAIGSLTNQIVDLRQTGNRLATTTEAQVEAIRGLSEALNHLITPDLKDATMHVVRMVDRSAGLVVEGRIDTMQITDTQDVIVTWGKPIDKKGFPAAIQGDPVFAVSDDAVTISPVDGDPFSIKVSGVHPSALGDDGVTPVAGTLTITGDADLGDGVEAVTGSEPYIITGGQAVGFAAPTVGTPVEQP